MRVQVGSMQQQSKATRETTKARDKQTNNNKTRTKQQTDKIKIKKF